MSPRPTFLLIGAARSGTTALFEYLDQHPDVFLADPKEPHFFALEGHPLDFRGPGDDLMINDRAVTDWDRYLALFAKAGRFAARGEASVSSLYSPRAAAAARNRLPDAKLLCILRHPVDRAYSAFLYMRSRTYEPLSDFRVALAAEEERIASGWHHIWHYRSMSRYAEQLERWLDAFGPDRVRVFLHDELRADPLRVVRESFEWIGVDPGFVPPDRPSALVSGVPKNAALQKLLMAARPLRNRFLHLVPRRLGRRMKRRLTEANLRSQAMDPALRAELVEEFASQVVRLERLLGRDLRAWKS